MKTKISAYLASGQTPLGFSCSLQVIFEAQMQRQHFLTHRTRFNEAFVVDADYKGMQPCVVITIKMHKIIKALTWKKNLAISLYTVCVMTIF